VIVPKIRLPELDDEDRAALQLLLGLGALLVGAWILAPALALLLLGGLLIFGVLRNR